MSRLREEIERLESLTDRQRWVVLGMLEGRSQTELAEELNLARQNITREWIRAREKLSSGLCPWDYEEQYLGTWEPAEGFSVVEVTEAGILASEGWLQCARCGSWVIELSPRSGPRHDRFCRECVAFEKKASYHRDPSGQKAANRRLRARRMGAEGPGVSREEVLEAQNGVCYLRISDGCQARDGLMKLPWVVSAGPHGVNRDSVVVEHVRALADGGSNHRSNLMGACSECNSQKEYLRRGII